jgi:hypothetical protein
VIHHHQPVVEQAREAPVDRTFDPLALAEDLREVRRIYDQFFATLDTTGWDRPARRGRDEWTLHETIAHLCALNGDGLDSITRTLNSESYTFRGLETRYDLNAYNRTGIDEHLDMLPDALIAEFFRVHDGAADIAQALQPAQAQLTAVMPIYNRPIQIVEALGIIVMHTGLIHTAQVAEPAGVPPLWTQLSPEIRHREIGRQMRALSLLYDRDIGGSLRAVLVFRVDGPGGGDWHVEVSPEAATAGEGVAESPTLALRFRTTDDFCRMATGRMSLPIALISRKLKVHGDLRLFRRMDKLFKVG